MFKKFMFVFILIPLSLTACAEETKSLVKSWWLEVKFQPECSPIFNKYFVDSSVCYSVLTRDLLMRKNPNYLEKLDTLNFVFNSYVDINSDDIEEYVAVGIYSREGKEGQFLVIAEDSGFKKIYKIFERGNFKGFSALSIQGSVVNWYSCMDCNNKDKVIRLSDDYFLD